MTDTGQKSSTRRTIRKAVCGALLLLVVIGAAWYLTSDSFREVIRHRLVTQLEDATGGQVEIGRVEWNLSRLQIAIDGLTVHGLEGPNDNPLVHINRIDGELRIVSLLSRQFSFNALAIDSPALNLIIYPDGRTNQPTPRARHKGGQQGPLDMIFDIAIRNFSVKNGLLQVNELRTPFELRANDVAADISYTANPESYAGKVKIGKFDTHWRDDRPFSSSAAFDFRLYRNALEMRSAQIVSERSELSFEGKLENFSEPQVALRYKAKLDLRQAGSIVRVLEFRSGMLQIDGNAQYRHADFSGDGKLQLSDGGWNQEAVHASGVSGSATFHVDRDSLQISQLLANALGGTVAGEMTVLHWNAPSREPEMLAAGSGRSGKNEHVIGAREQAADAKFDLRGLQVERIAALFTTKRLPLADLRASGVADGKAELIWTGSPRFSELRLDVHAVPNTSQGDGQMPVAAHLHGTFAFHDHSLQIGQAELHTPATHLTAMGTFGAEHLDLAVGVSTTNPHEFQPLLAANGAGDLAVHLAGEGSFQGTIEGRTDLPALSGHLKLSDFTTVFRPASATAPQPELVQALHRRGRTAAGVQQAATSGANANPVSLHWDSFDGYVVYGPDSASLRGAILRSGYARFEIAANTTLLHGTLTDASLFHATARIREARVEDMQTILGLSYPVEGALNLELQMQGTRLDPQGSGKLSIADGRAYGEPLESISTDLVFSGREARFTNLHAVSGEARVDGSGSINVSTEQFRFDAQGVGVDLLRFSVLQTPRVKLAGVASFTAKGSGTLSAPAFDGHMHISKITLGDKREGDLEIDATTIGEELHLKAASKFVTANLTAEGRIRLRGDMASDIKANFGSVDLQPFLVGVARGHSSIDGTLHVTGPLRHPKQLNARLEIPGYESDVEGVVLRNAGPIVATYSDGTATLESFRLTGDATDISSSGTVQLVGGQELHMRADGQLNLKLLQSFDPEIVSYGHTMIGVQLRGTLHEPAMRGRITIEHAGISYVDLPNGLSDLNGTLVFNENRLQVEKLTAHTGGGDLAIGGFIAYGRTVSFNLTATGKDVRIRYPEGVSANGDADLRLAGTLQNATLSGEVVINKFGLNPRFDFAYYLSRSKQLSTAPNPDSALNSLHFDVRVVSTPELQVETSLAKITGDVDLRLRGSAMRPVVLGRINIVEGDITFNGTKYRLDRGDILFTNPTKIEPMLDLEASARVSNYDISIGLHGTTDKLNTTYRSDPPLPTADVFALLAFGRTTDVVSGPQSNAYTETASSAVLGSALNAAVSSRVQKLFGVSRIKIDPQVGGAENNPNARITVEQQVSGNITLTYITNLTQSAQQVIQFQYNMNRNVSIVGVRDEYGVVGFEVQIRQRKR